jgi:hypothetical protein
MQPEIEETAPEAPAPIKSTHAPESKAGSKRLGDFPGLVGTIEKKIEAETLIVNVDGEEKQRKINKELFLEFLMMSEGLLEPDEDDKLRLGTMPFKLYSDTLAKDWQGYVKKYWQWVDETYGADAP